MFSYLPAFGACEHDCFFLLDWNHCLMAFWAELHAGDDRVALMRFDVHLTLLTSVRALSMSRPFLEERDDQSGSV